ncbi:hypothetical protein BLEM_1004 [Bifidobacterium lemurum]|uniref:ABC transporter permease n=1 Tax=Bifidobacterium lemurum TaxID=1603886 RepID=A0A261FTP0_9BIFI|nr:hypothetical protein [Bifidobacterium lemurum]OZG62458.1 hypothetical protein BLEM_1004 [Bifidobacterium lemurum]QOL33801.1 hypothetical protein BL8807_08450 [Bifidobacterium lemurum]
MHWTYKIASILALALIVVTGGLYAQNCEETYPSGPQQDIIISNTHNGTLSQLLNIAASHHTMIARYTFEPNGHGGNERVISVFGSTDDGADFAADQPYPDYGFSIRTRVRQGDDMTAPLGRWLVYGGKSDAEAMVNDVRAAGFELAICDGVDFPVLVSRFFSNSLASIVFVGFIVVFVSAALSASVSSRMCAIQSLHGMNQPNIVIRQSLRHAAFFFGCALTGWFAWAVLGLIFWPSASPLGFAGRMLLSIMAISAGICLILTSLAIAMVRIMVPHALALLKGRRPMRFLMAVSCIGAVTLLCLVNASAGTSLSKLEQARASAKSLKQAQSSSRGLQLQLWYVSDQTRTTYMPNWNGFIKQSTDAERIRFSSLDETCTWVDASGESACIIMDSQTAVQQHLMTSASSGGSITVLLPSDGQWDTGTLTDNVLATYAFQQSQAMREGLALPSLDARDVVVDVCSRDGVPTPFNADADYPHAPVIIMNASLLSGDATSAMVSTGAMIFDNATRQQIITDLDDSGARPLVASVVNRSDEIQTRLARNLQEIAFFATTAVISFTCAIGSGIMVALTLCTLRRQSMFVEYIHGASLRLRFGPAMTLAVALFAPACLISPFVGTNSALSLSIAVMFDLALLATTVAYDSRLRADSIKHP